MYCSWRPIRDHGLFCLLSHQLYPPCLTGNELFWQVETCSRWRGPHPVIQGSSGLPYLPDCGSESGVRACKTALSQALSQAWVRQELWGMGPVVLLNCGVCLMDVNCQVLLFWQLLISSTLTTAVKKKIIKAGVLICRMSHTVNLIFHFLTESREAEAGRALWWNLLITIRSRKCQFLSFYLYL